MQNNELEQENNHIKFWENCLNDLKTQFEIITNFIDFVSKYKSQKQTDLSSILNKYRNDTKNFTKEPSHIYYLCEIFFDFQSCLWEIINESSSDLYNKINSMSNEIVKDIDDKKTEICQSNLLLIDECQKLIIKIKTQENEFQKIKSLMDNAQINQNKIKSKLKNSYNVAEIKKADLLLAEQIRKMEEIKIPMEQNKKKLNEMRSKINTSIREAFEKVLTIYFKHLANIHQFFFLLTSSKLDLITNMKKRIGLALSQLSNLTFDLNDYTEKKFGELIGIKYDGIIMFDSEEILNKSSLNSLLKISYDIINYIQVFLLCLRYRKKIMKIFLEAVKTIIRCEEKYKKSFYNYDKNVILQISELKYISEQVSKNLSSHFNEYKSNVNNDYSLIISSCESYINSARNEYNKFKFSWDKYEEKIKENQKNLIEILKDKKESKTKDEKFRDIIKESIGFINNNVYNIREKDKNEISEFSLIFEKLFHKSKTTINKLIDKSEEEISSIANLDLFEECKIIIVKYFNNFKIQNYENFLEKMRVKLLLNTQLQNEKISKDVLDKLNDKFNEKDDDIINYQKELSNNDSKLKEILENEENISQIKNINTIYFESKKSQNIFLENINNLNKKSSNNVIKGNNSIENEKEIEKEIYNNEEIEEEEDSLDLLDKDKFKELTKIENPYKNIKEDELKRLKSITDNKYKMENDLDEDEKRLDTFNCALKDKILLQGKLSITNKKIEFNSFFNSVTFLGKTTIHIPLKDIIEIEKKYYLALDNSIQIKTEKISYLFTSFLSRDKCFVLLEAQINQIKEKIKLKEQTKKPGSNKNLDKTEINFSQKFRPKEIIKILEDMNFNIRLTHLTKERLKLFSKKYKNEKEFKFLSNEIYSKKFISHIFKSCPLYICFKYICNASTQLDELGYSKGFFESILLENVTEEIMMIEKDEFNDDDNKFNHKIPDYFNNEDYVMDLFCSYDQNELENFLSEAQNWIHKYEYDCYGLNEKKRNEKSATLIAYFISPILLYFDIIDYSAGLRYGNNYILLYRYRFDSNIKYNKKRGKFDFITKLTVLFKVQFLSKTMISDNTYFKIYDEYEELFKKKVFNKILNIVNNYIQIFGDIYEKKTEEILQKNNFSFDYENDNSDELSDNSEFTQNDINIFNDLSNSNNLNNENRNELFTLGNINICENSGDDLIKTKRLDEGVEKKDKDKNEKRNNIKDNDNNEIEQKKIQKQNLIYIIIIVILVVIIITLLFSKDERRNKFDFNTIINILILGSLFYLLKEK